MPNHTWPEDHFKRAADLAGQNYSGDGIAMILSREFHVAITRNAVIGKLHRAGISFGKTRGPAKPKKPRGRTHTAVFDRIERIAKFQRTIAVEVAPVEEPTPPEFLCVSLMDLRDDQCKFPHGEGLNTTFCGQDRRRDSFGLADSPYCRNHHAICHNVPKLSDEERQRRSIHARKINSKRHIHRWPETVA